MKEKETLYTFCLDYVQQRINRILDEISRAQSSANEETKSSAGDKYETSRAMAQLEVERNTIQLREAEKLQALLQNILKVKITDDVKPGALVTTSKGVFYLAISIGAATVNEKEYFIISADSPIGQILIGKKTGSSFSFQGRDYLIHKIE